MNHRDHVELLRPAGIQAGGVWADLGAGSGAFTLALRELAGPQARIQAVDRDRMALAELRRRYRKRFGTDEGLVTVSADFASEEMDLPQLDGILMANSLHFFPDKWAILARVRSYLRPAGMLLLVEYNVERGNHWVPYPISFEHFLRLAPQAGFGKPRLLGKMPSSFLKEFYSAMVSRAAHPPDGRPAPA